ncbi:hypothetical protein SBADM41S_05497 [Streptomyces badius]
MPALATVRGRFSRSRVTPQPSAVGDMSRAP